MGEPLTIEEADQKLLTCGGCGLGFAVFHDPSAGAPPTVAHCPACGYEEQDIQEGYKVEERKELTGPFPGIPEGHFRTITVCGSTKFKEEYEWLHKELILRNWLVYSVGAYGHRDKDPRIGERKERLDAIHIAKISKSDAVFIINPGRYIGKSTGRELEAAVDLRKLVYYWEEIV